LCTKTPLLGGVEQPKKSPQNPGNFLFDVLLMSRIQNFAADAAKKPALRTIVRNHASRGNLRSARFFETMLRADLVNSN